MAEINNGDTGHGKRKGGVRRSKKLSTKVDLTPMVDLGFLLITFFVFTTSMSKPKEMPLILPAGDTPSMPSGETTTLTIIPIANDKIFYYHGQLDNAVAKNLYGVTSFSLKNGIGDIIRDKQKKLNASVKFKKEDLMLIIKPTQDASYQNVVNALDEVLINVLKHYVLADLDDAEKETLAKLGIK
ncbi:MAG: biopolymer transporter ExbD [Chitinophagaceae bacterium]